MKYASPLRVTICKKHDGPRSVIHSYWGSIVSIVLDAITRKKTTLEDSVAVLQFVVATLLPV
jgi:hypothetical protein